jgi:hypothetical protein
MYSLYILFLSDFKKSELFTFSVDMRKVEINFVMYIVLYKNEINEF